MMTEAEKELAKSDFDLVDFSKRFMDKLDIVKVIGQVAAAEYTNTYRQGGSIMRFSDIFRKFKRLEKQYIEGAERKREKTEDDLKDLITYAIVMWIYLDELEDEDARLIGEPITEGD